MAKSLFDRALAIARERGDQIATALLQVSLGDALAAGGNITSAAERYRDGLSAAQKLADWRTMLGCLRGLASVAMAAGRAEPVVRLLAVEEAWRAPNRLHIFDYVAERRARDLGTARSVLGQGPFATAWDEGTALRSEEAVAEALAMAAELANASPV